MSDWFNLNSIVGLQKDLIKDSKEQQDEKE